MSDIGRVVLISPYSHISAIGLRYLSASLRAAGRETRMIFLPDPDELAYRPKPHRQAYPAEVVAQVVEACSGAGLVGIGVMTNFVERARCLTDAIHERLGVPVIWGGIHATVRPDECLEWADYVCIGEGEAALVDLVDRLAVGRAADDIPNIWSRRNGDTVRNSPRPLCRDLDALPRPDYDLDTQVVLHEGRLQPLTPMLATTYLRGGFADEQRSAYMAFTTRGCPHDCTYCCNNAYLKLYPDWRFLRRHSLGYITEELTAARKLLPALEAVMFMDDSFLATGIDDIRRFCHAYAEHVGLPFFVMATPSTVSAEKLRLLVDAGLRDVEMGIQVGSDHIRSLYGRPETDAQVLRAARAINDLEQWIPRPRYDLITDNPYETPEDQLATARLLSQLPRPYALQVHSLDFFPGTQLHRRASADGLIRDEAEQIYRKNMVQPWPSYYNFVLWGLPRRFPRWLVRWLTQRLSFRILGSEAMAWLFRLVYPCIMRLRHGP